MSVVQAQGNVEDAQNSSTGRTSLIVALVLVVGVMVVEIAVGMISGSLAILSAAGLSFATAIAIGVALFTAWAESKPPSIERTFGYHRAEVAGAMLGGLVLWLVAAWVLFESINRLRNYSDLEIDGGLMMIVAIVGLAANIVASAILRWGSRNSVPAGDAFRHLVSDFIGSIGVVVAAVMVQYSGWTLADPVVSTGIAALIAASSWRLMLKVFYAIMEGTPEELDLYQLCADIEDVPGVTLIHDVHAWSISDGYHALTAHVLVEPGQAANSEHLLRQMRHLAYDKHNIGQMTIQICESADECRENQHLDHLEARSRTER